MYFDDAKIGYIVHESVAHFSVLRDILVKLTNIESDEHREYIRAIRPLLTYICDRNCALVMLIQNGYLWDAEMLMRPILEASLKVLFISYANLEERAARITEYWQSLPEVTQLKQSERVRITLERLPEEARMNDVLRPLVLSSQDEQKLRTAWPKHVRKRIEQKWSFSEMIREVERFMGEHLNVPLARSLGHNYGMSSHLIHADETGVSLPHDRDSREPEERKKLERAHAARLTSDRLSFAALVAIGIAFATGQSRQPIGDAVRSAEPLFTELHRLEDAFYDHIQQ